MQYSRRHFLAGGVGSLFAAGLKTNRASGQEPTASNRRESSTAEKRKRTMNCLDYGTSFLCNPAAFNSVRFWIESRTTIFDDQGGTAVEFYQCASCKSENTFGEKDLLYEDNYDFLPIFGGDNLLIFRRKARLNENYRQVTRAEEVWGQPILKLREGRQVMLLEAWEEIRDTTAAGVPIVSQTEFENSGTGLRAVIECPVKTMNISIDKRMYQVDTGPVAFPDLTKRYERLIECLSLAFVVFNAPDFADFVVEQPTPVVEDGVEKCRIYHYSNPFSLPARNRLLAVALPD